MRLRQLVGGWCGCGEVRLRLALGMADGGGGIVGQMLARIVYPLLLLLLPKQFPWGMLLLLLQRWSG